MLSSFKCVGHKCKFSNRRVILECLHRWWFL